MKRLAAALAAVFALSACAVTGQPANPGTAATYGDVVITTEQVAAWGTAEVDMGYSYDVGAILTLLLLRPTLDAEAVEQGIVFDDEQLSLEASMWMASNGAKVTEPTADMTELVKTVRILYAMLSTEEGSTAVASELEAIEADAQASPMYGDFSAEHFVESVTTLAQAQQASGDSLGDMSYLVFKDVTGFDPAAQRDWMVDEGAPAVDPLATIAP